MDYSFYDYNGTAFLFGKIYDGETPGYSQIKYAEIVIDDKYHYSKEIQYTDNVGKVFNVSTYYNGTDNSMPKQLSGGEHSVKLNVHSLTGEILDTFDMGNINIHAVLTPPRITYDNKKKSLTVSRSETASGEKEPRYFLEIRRKDRKLVNTAYTEEEKDYFYTVIAKGIEGGKYNEAFPHTGLMGSSSDSPANSGISVYSDLGENKYTEFNPGEVHSCVVSYPMQSKTFTLICSESGYYTFKSAGRGYAKLSVLNSNGDSYHSINSDGNFSEIFYLEKGMYTVSVQVVYYVENSVMRLYISKPREHIDEEPYIRVNRPQNNILKVNIIFDTDAVKSSYGTECITIAKEALSSIETIIQDSGYEDFEIEISETYNICDIHQSYDDLSGALDEYYDTFANDYNLTVRIGYASTTKMNGQNIEGVHNQGKWNTYMTYYPQEGVILSMAVISVDDAIKYETLKHVIHEEIYQSLGIGDDCYSHENSIHWNPEYSNPESYTGIDKTLLQMAYAKDINGYTAFDMLNEFDTPAIMCREYKEGDDNGYVFSLKDVFGKLMLDKGEYVAYAWCVLPGDGNGSIASSNDNIIDGWDDDLYSTRTSLEFSISADLPDKWEWTESELKAFRRGGGFKALSANRYNAFCLWVYDVYVAFHDENADIKKGINNSLIKYNKSALIAVGFNNLLRCANAIGDKRLYNVVKKYDFVRGIYFIKIADTLNNLLEM